MADLFEAMAAPARRAILDVLRRRDGQTLFEICSRLSMTQNLTLTRQAISQHLEVLESAGSLSTIRSHTETSGVNMARANKTPKVVLEEKVPICISELWSADAERQGAAYQEMLTLTVESVDWADSVMTEVFLQLSDTNNRNRSIAAQLLCRLAKSDGSKRILRDFPKLFSVVKDERFVTARHALQSMWLVACVGDPYRKKVLESLKEWYFECVSHKNCTLIRYDIIESLRKIYDDAMDEKIRALAAELIEHETDSKYQKKYRTLWSKKSNESIG